MFLVSGFIFWKKDTKIKIDSSLKTFTILGDSMEPTISNGEDVVVDRGYYKKNRINRGDIVAISFSLSANKIKRIVAIGGDKVEFRDDGKLIVNDIPSPDNYIKDKDIEFEPSRLKIIKIQLGDKGIVPDNYLLVLGDNRFSSEDSQQFGLVLSEQLMGKVIYKKTGWFNSYF